MFAEIAKKAEQNVSFYLEEMARLQPNKPAVTVPACGITNNLSGYTQRTFADINDASNSFAHALYLQGVRNGDRVLLMVRPGLDFFSLAYAIFRVGAAPVLIDPGMGFRNFARCVKQAEPKFLIGIPAAHLLRYLYPADFRSVQQGFTLSRFSLPGTPSIFQLPTEQSHFVIQEKSPDDIAAILFTTGSTGPAKGVIYTHRIFSFQTEILRNTYGLGLSDLDMPCFPLFGLFSIALGAGTVIPAIDPSKPAKVDPAKIINPIKDKCVTYSFGSPALWQRVADHCINKGIKLPSLQKIFMAGAPVPGTLHEKLLNHVLTHPDAEIHIPYGATEALPATTFSGSEALETWPLTRQGAGICIGRPISQVDVRVIPISDKPLKEECLKECASGQIGEILVKGPVVTPAYYELPEENEHAKVDTSFGFWHRMGDVGYYDDQNRLWFCGRRGHRVCTGDKVLFTVQCEAIFNEHPLVFRSALVGIGGKRSAQKPVIIIEPIANRFPRSRKVKESFAKEILDWGTKSPLTKQIGTVLFHRSFPVDIRHNAKIKREVLAKWATIQLRK